VGGDEMDYSQKDYDRLKSTGKPEPRQVLREAPGCKAYMCGRGTKDGEEIVFVTLSKHIAIEWCHADLGGNFYQTVDYRGRFTTY
jgi:hypothetical protein